MMEEQARSETIRRPEERMEMMETFSELRAEIRGLRDDIQSLRRTMIYGSVSIDGLMLILIGLQLA
ncbi:MAG TPA: hypothetical protein VFY69_08455 [Solirubrobacterales bacterium]|nr:hypothetical protein [Solirubrobacterales bacterium]